MSPTAEPVKKTAQHAHQLEFQVITDLERLDALEPEWNELWSARQSPEPMQSYRWLRAWWRHYGAERSLAIGLLRDRGRLIGIAPCCMRRFRYLPGLGFRRLEWLGASEGEGDSIASEYLGLLVMPGYEYAVAEAFAEGVENGAFGTWDECVLEMMRGDAETTVVLESALLESFGDSLDRVVAMEAPFVALPSDWNGYLASLGRKRRLVSNALRDFETWCGDGGYVLRRAADRPTFDKAYASLVELHEERWRADGGVGAFSRPRFAAFHADVAWRMLSEERAEFLWLERHGQAIAAHYLIKGDDRTLFYQSGRRMDVPSDIRLGVVIMALAIKDAIMRGDKEFDLLGGKSQYKMMFTREVRPLVRLRVARDGWRELTRRSLITLRDLARAVPARLQSRRRPQPSRSD